MLVGGIATTVINAVVSKVAATTGRDSSATAEGSR